MSTPEPLTAEAPEIPAAPAAAAATLPAIRVVHTLVKRELWEHRVLWLAPLAVALLMLVATIPASPGAINFDFGTLTPFAGAASTLGGHFQLALFGLVHWLLSLPLYTVLVLVLSFYLSDTLYAERKDRSILFWKSLPVSDLCTVGSKALVGLVLIPIGVYLLAVATDLALSGIWYLRAHLGVQSPSLVPWDGVAWLKVQALLGVGLILSILWYAPIGAYLLLVSAWARRNPVIWASVPPLLAPLIERQAAGTHYLWDFLNYRTWGVLSSPGLQDAMQAASLRFNPHISVVSPAELFDALSLWRLFASVDLWLGVLAAAAMIWGAARIRRHRDDS